LKDNEGRALKNWLGQYLLRLHGLAEGNPAHLDILEEWTRNWRRAKSGQTITPRLKEGLRELIMPRSQLDHGEDLVVLPLLDSHCRPVVGQSRAPTLCYGLDQDQLNLKIAIKHDRLMVDLTRDQDRVASIHLDFMVCREALACTKGAPGFTETGLLAAPRIERARASLIAPRGAEIGQTDVFIADNRQLINLEVQPR
jgi:hypothetical protein